MVFERHFLIVLLCVPFTLYSQQTEKKSSETKTASAPTSEDTSDQYLLDTTQDTSGGNWFLKREFSLRAKALYEKLLQAITTIDKSQDFFIDARIKMTKELNEFYTSLGYQQGQLEILVQQVISELQKQRQEKGLNIEDRTALIQLTEKYQELEQFLKGTTLIKEGDANLNSAIKKVLETIAEADSYSDKAWKNIQEIDSTLDHEHAQLLYDQIVNYLHHIETLNNSYINTQLKQYFEETATRIKAEMQKVKAKLTELQERGILLKAELAKDNTISDDKKSLSSDITKLQTEEPREQTWWEKISIFFSHGWLAIKDVFVNLYESIFG